MANYRLGPWASRVRREPGDSEKYVDPHEIAGFRAERRRAAASAPTGDRVVNPSPVRVKFWGVRGSVPTPGLEQAEMGGNTACVEVVLEDRHPVILDGGTGLRALGLDLVRRSARPGGRASLLLSHLHWDHIQGIPFFAPMYDPDWAITFYSLLPPDDLRRFVRIQTNQPYFSARSSIRATRSSDSISRA